MGYRQGVSADSPLPIAHCPNESLLLRFNYPAILNYRGNDPAITANDVTLGQLEAAGK